MSSTAVIGMQWGDEAKGRVVDVEAEKHHMVVRYNGGNNAGHTVKVGDRTYKLHLVPSGIIWEKPCILGNGMVIDPEALVQEMEDLDFAREKIYISDRAHLVMPQHRVWEKALEESRGESKIGTTGRGIGTTYAAKMLRSGFRVGDLVDRRGEMNVRTFWEKLLSDPLFDMLYKTYGVKLSKKDTAEKYFGLAERFADRVRDTSAMIYEALRSGEDVLFEGAQGTMLDIDHGTYPYVTSSNTTIGALSTGTGVAVRPDRVIGVLKAYTTRVGGGPFPTELKDETGERIRERGAEYGTTTGRPRRCGWLDLVVARYAKEINGITEIALTKLDVLSGLPEVRVCCRYVLDGETIDSMPSRLGDLEICRSEFHYADGWEEDITGACSMKELPENARFYVSKISDSLGIPLTMVSVGPEREQKIMK